MLSGFLQGTAVTLAARITSLFLGLGLSVFLARFLGPEGRGLYALVFILPSLIATFGNLGVGQAAVYHTARQSYPRQDILGTSMLLALMVSAVGLIVGLVLVLFFRSAVVPGVPQELLLMGLLSIPASTFFQYVNGVLLGAKRFDYHAIASISHSLIFLVLATILLGLLGMGIPGAVLAAIVAWVATDMLLLVWARKEAGGIEFRMNRSYAKDATAYGIKIHLGNILGFLNYRIDIFLVNAFLDPRAVGLYSLGVGLAEKLWLVSQAASTVLFPTVAGESSRDRRNELTELVARTTFWITAAGSGALAYLASPLIRFLYGEAFLPSVGAVRALLAGVVAVSVGRVLANDIAGRGRPMLSAYSSVAALAVNIMLNILWIPKMGISGAAWASTASYGTAMILRTIIYCHLSGSRWTYLFVLRNSDLRLYWKGLRALARRVCQYRSSKRRGSRG